MDQREHERILGNWRDERDGAALYDALGSLEKDERLRRVFGKLADSEREHAAFWEERLRAEGRTVPQFRPCLLYTSPSPRD